MDTHTDFVPTLTANGRPGLRHLPTGRVLPIVSGGDGPLPPGTPAAPPAGGEPPVTPPVPPATGTPPAGPPASEPTFTQADLDKHAGRRAAEAKRAAESAIAEQLGCTVDEAKAIIAAKQQADEAAKTDVQKAQDAQAAAEARATELEAQTVAQAFEGRVKDQLVLAGVIAEFDLDKDDDRKAAGKRIEMARRLLDLPIEATDEEIAAKVAEVRTDVPGLFGAAPAPAAGGVPPRIPSGTTPGKPPAGGQAAVTGLDAGRARAQAAKQSTPPADPLARWAGKTA